MAEIQTRSFPQIVAEQAVAAQAQAPDKALDFSPGSPFLALAEAFGTVGLWLQAQLLKVLVLTRAATSRGADLDSWMADYEVERPEAEKAKGRVTLGRFTPTQEALVRLDATVRTTDGGWTYRVVKDATLATWSEARQGYVVPAGVASAVVPVEAVTAGIGGNAAAGTVTRLSSAVPGIDTATNAAPFTGGTEAEPDDALRDRFRAYLASLSRATEPAIDYAIGSVQAGLSWTVLEGQRPDGTPSAAYMTIVVDDGSGSASADLLRRVSAAVEEVRALGVGVSVIAAVPLVVDVGMTLATTPGVDHSAVVAAVSLAARRFIDALPLGSALSYTRLAQVAYAASPYVTNVSSILLAGGTADVAAGVRQKIRAGVVSVS